MEAKARDNNSLNEILSNSIGGVMEEVEGRDLGPEEYEELLEKEKEGKDRKTMKKKLKRKEKEVRNLFGNKEECYVDACKSTSTRLKYGSTPDEDKFLCRKHHPEYEDREPIGE